MQASMKAYSDLYTWLEKVKSDYRAGKIQDGQILDGPFGSHGTMEGDDIYEGGGHCLTVGFCLPDGVYAETEDGTYGQLQGFRIYLDGSED